MLHRTRTAEFALFSIPCSQCLPLQHAVLVLGEQAGEAERAMVRHRLGLDVPLGSQFFAFTRGLVALDLGDSLRRPGTPAFAVVSAALGPTARLAGVAVGLGALAGIGAALLTVGPWLGRYRERVHDVAVIVGAVPLLALAPAATFWFSVQMRLLPLPGDPDSGLLGLLFASGLLAIPLAAQVTRIGRAALLELRQAPFLRVAAAKGAGPLRIWIVHALPVAAAPIATVVATQLGALLGGAVVLERLFDRPGLGTVMLDAYSARDLPVLEAAVVAAGLLFVVTQTVASLVTALVDPRGSES